MRIGRATTLSVAGFAVFLVSVVLLSIWGPVGATHWLYLSDRPVASDLLVILGGGSSERMQTGLALYHQGMAPAILVTDPLGYPDVLFRRLEAAGVPARALIAPLSPSTSTWEDALSIRQIVMEKGLRSVLVVTSPYHCRRARLAMNRVFRGICVRITVTASVSLYMDPGRWWGSRQGWLTVAKEYPKLFWYWLSTPPARGELSVSDPS